MPKGNPLPMQRGDPRSSGNGAPIRRCSAPIKTRSIDAFTCGSSPLSIEQAKSHLNDSRFAAIGKAIVARGTRRCGHACRPGPSSAPRRPILGPGWLPLAAGRAGQPAAPVRVKSLSSRRSGMPSSFQMPQRAQEIIEVRCRPLTRRPANKARLACKRKASGVRGDAPARRCRQPHRARRLPRARAVYPPAPAPRGRRRRSARGAWESANPHHAAPVPMRKAIPSHTPPRSRPSTRPGRRCVRGNGSSRRRRRGDSPSQPRATRFGERRSPGSTSASRSRRSEVSAGSIGMAPASQSRSSSSRRVRRRRTLGAAEIRCRPYPAAGLDDAAADLRALREQAVQCLAVAEADGALQGG